MSVNTIAVCGSPGSGKSLVSLALSHSLNECKKSVVLVSLDRTTPMFSCFMPFNKFEEKNSLGALLNASVEKQALKNRLHCNELIPDTAFMCFGTGDSLQKYSIIQSFKLEELFKLLSEYTDYIICDLPANPIAEKSSLFLLNYCNTLITLLTPDNAGLSFADTYFPIMQESDSSAQLQLTAISNAYDYSPSKTIMKERDIKYLFLHSKALYLSYLAGEPLTRANDTAANAFKSTLTEIRERILANDRERI